MSEFALTTTVRDRICDAIGHGVYLEDALRLADVNVSAYYRWLEAAENEHGPHAAEYQAFKEAVEIAQAQYQAHYLGKIREAAERTWTAAAWLLERRWPQKYALRNRTELSGPDGQPVKIVFEFVKPKADSEDDQAEDS